MEKTVNGIEVTFTSETPPALYLSSSFRKYTYGSIKGNVATFPVFPPNHAKIVVEGKQVVIFLFPNVKNYFIESAITMKYELEQRGIRCDIIDDWSLVIDRKIASIVFGLNGTPNFTIRSTDIIVNMEQWSPESRWFTKEYVEQLKTHEVWDYCEFNCRNLEKNLGVKAKLFQYGYVPSLHTLIPSDIKDIDVLHYGANHPRRTTIRDQLLARGIRAHFYDLKWGEERSRIWGRTKIFVNIHAYHAGLLETARLSLVLNNGLFVISEIASDICNYTDWGKCIVFVPYDQLVDTIIKYLSQPELIESFSRQAYVSYQGIRPIVPLLN